eukprot:CAMPEP_0113526682 /NCGR_PEP_ID=MMETSP0015_2-20120614/881_1 /TAXON_ID=2838 /ORGANISM="Odontella" /LENGTH=483 /DNA_ID=CAMNT_0000425043 /DNA_START=209 /DNA_END=1660 /DNA_ORIENTATION=+ /assembly_acc=CAM_ASM_000160
MRRVRGTVTSLLAVSLTQFSLLHFGSDAFTLPVRTGSGSLAGNGKYRYRDSTFVSVATTDDEASAAADAAPSDSAAAPQTSPPQSDDVDVDRPPPRRSSSPYSTVKAGIGKWEEMHGNYLLRPPAETEPRALIHFLGGAIVGAAPDVTYRYVLERLAARGYLVVATPFNLSFDHLKTCDEVIAKFERIAGDLARQYGAVPVVGMGHSCGALLQILITSLFPDTPRAANALLSYNNKPVKDAVPLFEEVVAPFFTAIAARGNETWYPSGTVAMALAVRLGRAAAKGEIPSNDLLADVAKFVTPKRLSSIAPEDVALPSRVRDALTTVVDPAAGALESAGVLPVLSQAVDVLEQIPLLVEEVADGATDFNPTPSSVRAAARRAYRARRTLLLQYDSDPLDESEEIEELLREAETVMRMKRPMISIDIQRRVLKGGHASPVLAPPVDIAERAEDILGAETAKERLLYAEADATVEELARWLDEGQL